MNLKELYEVLNQHHKCEQYVQSFQRKARTWHAEMMLLPDPSCDRWRRELFNVYQRDMRDFTDWTCTQSQGISLEGACSIKVDCDWLSRLSHKQSFIHCFSTARKVDEVSDKLVKTVEHLAKMDIFLCCVKHVLSVCRSVVRIYLHIVQGSEVWSQVVTGDKCWDAFYCQVWTDRHCLCPLCDC